MTISNRSFGARSMRHYFAGWMLLIGYDETLSRHDWWVLPAVKIWTIWIVCCSPAFPHLNDWSLVQPNRSLPEPLIRMCEGGFDAQIGQSIGCCLSAIGLSSIQTESVLYIEYLQGRRRDASIHNWRSKNTTWTANYWTSQLCDDQASRSS